MGAGSLLLPPLVLGPPLHLADLVVGDGAVPLTDRKPRDILPEEAVA